MTAKHTPYKKTAGEVKPGEFIMWIGGHGGVAEVEVVGRNADGKIVFDLDSGEQIFWDAEDIVNMATPNWEDKR